MEAPAAASISSKDGPAARIMEPFTSSGSRMQFFLEAKPPASQASASTSTPASLISS
jgi:hypothetical protein